jgi:hypothetical protein
MDPRRGREFCEEHLDENFHTALDLRKMVVRFRRY